MNRMKMTCGLVALAALVAAVPASAQPAPPGPTTLATALQRGYNNIKMNLTQSADKLSDADYGFKVGTMAETRTFGQLFGHVANSQFGTCAAAKGVANPNMGNNFEETAKTKADVVKALAASFAFCDDAFSSLTDATAMQMIKQGQGEIVRAAALANLVAHSNEMYGTSAAYLRAKGVVPPSTERQTMGRGGR
jgi:DinB superfamily